MARSSFRWVGSRAGLSAMFMAPVLVSCSLPSPKRATSAPADAAVNMDGTAEAAAAERAEANRCSTSPAYIDGDGDGYGIEEGTLQVSYCGERGTPPAGYTWNSVSRLSPADCDDTDPNVYQLLYPDEDGDGVGVPTGAVCGGARAPGYASILCGVDCDDHDARRHPAAVEIFADGFDSDCDGEDNPECYAAYRLDPAPAPGTSTIRGDCVGMPDLVVAELLTCVAGCTVPTHVTLANLGDTAYQGMVTLRVFSLRDNADASTTPSDLEDLRQIRELSLAPGEVSQPILVGFVPGGRSLFRVEPAPADCDSGDEVPFYAPYIECVW